MADASKIADYKEAIEKMKEAAQLEINRTDPVKNIEDLSLDDVTEDALIEQFFEMGEELGVDTRQGSIYWDACMGSIIRTAMFFDQLASVNDIISLQTCRGDVLDEKLEETYSRWEKIRDFCFQIIRGKRTPLGFKIVLALPEDQIPHFLTAHGLTGYRPEEIRGLYLNFHYDGHHLQCITGTSLNTFTMDKSIEREWDTEVKSILKSKNIEGEY